MIVGPEELEQGVVKVCTHTRTHTHAPHNYTHKYAHRQHIHVHTRTQVKDPSKPQEESEEVVPEGGMAENLIAKGARVVNRPVAAAAAAGVAHTGP